MGPSRKRDEWRRTAQFIVGLLQQSDPKVENSI